MYHYGINVKNALHPLLYCMTMLDELRHRTHVYQLPQETADISDNVSVEELQEKLRALQNENKQFPPIYICAQMRYNDSKRVCGGTLCGR